jgi:branched-chain amino acid transport system permease protein
MIRERSHLFAMVVVGLVVVFSAPLWLPRFYVHLLTISLSLGITAMSFILLAGYGGMISLAQMAFYAMGAYVIGIGTMDLGWPTSLLLPLAVVAAALVAAVFGAIAIRSRGIYFLMMTLALSQLFYGVGLEWESVTHGWNGISGITRPSVFGHSLLEATPLYYTSLVVTGLCYLLLRRLVHSPFGIALRGIRDNPIRMAALGFNVNLYRFLAIVISGAFAGVAGILGVYYSGVISPHTANLSAIVQVLMAALIGGVARLEGGLLGALVTVLLVSFTSQYTSRYWMVVGAVFVAAVIFMPNGLLGAKSFGIPRLKKHRDVSANES